MYIHPDVRGFAPPKEASRRLPSIIGTRVRAARLRAGLKQTEVAHLVEISPIVYSRIERGRMLPGVQTLYRLCAALRTTPNELLDYPASLPPDVATAAKEALVRRVRQLDAQQALAIIQLLPDVR